MVEILNFDQDLCKIFTLVSRTQPSGPLCLWQCFQINWHPPTFSLSDSPFKFLSTIERYHFPGAHQLVLVKYSFKVFIHSVSSQPFKVFLPSVSKYFFKPTIGRYCFPGAEKVAG